MKGLKILSFCVLLGGGISFVHAAGWTVAAAPTNAKAAKAAMITNDMGYSLYVWRNESEDGVSLQAELQMAPGRVMSDKMPRYQIDQGVIVKLNRIPLEMAYGKTKAGWLLQLDKTVTWRLTDGAPKSIAKSDPLHAWADGNMIRFIFFDAQGVETTTEFSLKGVSSAFETATKIKFD